MKSPILPVRGDFLKTRPLSIPHKWFKARSIASARDPAQTRAKPHLPACYANAMFAPAENVRSGTETLILISHVADQSTRLQSTQSVPPIRCRPSASAVFGGFPIQTYCPSVTLLIRERALLPRTSFLVAKYALCHVRALCGLYVRDIRMIPLSMFI